MEITSREIFAFNEVNDIYEFLSFCAVNPSCFVYFLFCSVSHLFPILVKHLEGLEGVWGCVGGGKGGWEGLGWRARAESAKSNVSRTMAGGDCVFDVLPSFLVHSIEMFKFAQTSTIFCCMTPVVLLPVYR